MKIFIAVLIPLLIFGSGTANAGAREQAKRLHDRLTGTPPSASVLDSMEANLTAWVASPDETNYEQAILAAEEAMDDPAFYGTTLKNFVTPWTNEAQTVFAPLNDYTATVIGLVRDEADFREVLYDDVVYTGGSNLGLPAWSASNNDHYAAIEANNLDMGNPANLVARTQSEFGHLPAAATAGVITSRAGAHAFFVAGTNRAMLRFTLMNHLCTDLEPLKDITRPADRIRQDVSRSPGGDSRIFLNSCIGCHAGMDPLAQAFAYYEWSGEEGTDEGRILFNASGETDPETGTRVQAKYLINATNFPTGFITTDDRWDNYWRQGPNSLLGWDTNSLGEGALPGSGNGAKSLGMELANSEAFAECQVTKVFRNVCLRPPVDEADRDQVSSMVTTFKNGYNLKRVFAESALYCTGD